MICKICGKRDTEFLWRCEEHHCCDVCGIKENLSYRNRKLVCDSCHAEIVRKQVEAFGGDTNYEKEITCPWCGYVQSDSWEASDEDEHICSNCENEYSHARCVDVTYSTQKIETQITNKSSRHKHYCG
jgi:hypothetical protein